jgi:hypothetical protein
MTKNIIIGVLILVLIVTLLYFVWERRQSELEPPVEEPVPTPELVSRTLREETPEYLIDVSYPSIAGIEEARAAKASAAAEADARLRIAAFKSEVGKWESDEFDEPFGDIRSELHVEYSPALITPELISVVFQHSQYMAGAAHPLNYTNGWTWRLDKGELVTLEELFRPGAQYLRVLSDISRRELRAQSAERGYFPEDIDRGTEPVRENFRFFAMGEHELILFFSPYQVASYAAGIPEVRIPYEELSEIADPRGAIGVLTAP